VLLKGSFPCGSRLQGKDKPTFKPNADDGDVVVVVNAAQAELTGRKWEQKLYRWHTGYPGGLKERTAEQVAARKPGAELRSAVLGMLPKNNLRRVRPHAWEAALRWCIVSMRNSTHVPSPTCADTA
jgi:ribosomal protein L13